MSEHNTRVPVLIVGAGAAGLTTSTLLAKHGVRSLLVEKRLEVFIYPKARNLSFRSLEILRGLGLSDEVHAIAQRESTLVTRPTLNSAQEEPAIDLDARWADGDAAFASATRESIFVVNEPIEAPPVAVVTPQVPAPVISNCVPP